MYSSDSDSRDSAEKLDKSRNFNSTSKTAAKQDATQSSSSVLNNAKGAKSAGPKSKSNITNQVTGLQETKLDMLVEKGVEMLPGVVIGGAGGEGEHEEGGVKRTDSRKSLDEIVASSVASVVAASNISQPDAATSKAEQPTAGGVPGGVPGGAPGGMPGGAPGGVPGAAPGGVPGAVPGAKEEDDEEDQLKHLEKAAESLMAELTEEVSRICLNF